MLAAAANPMLRLWGVPQLDGTPPLRFAAERRFQLLAMLAMAGGQWVERDRAANLLWPEAGMADARRNLRKVLHMALALVGREALEASPQALRWRVATELALLQHPEATDPRVTTALRRGPPLQGLDDARNGAWTAWLVAERARLDTAWTAHAHAVLQTQPRPEDRIEWAQRLLDVDALDEAAVAALMRAELAAGRPAQAQLALRRYATLLGRELGVEPARGLADLLASPPVATPAARPVATPGGPAGAAGTVRFIGRRHELGELSALLQQADSRLITLLGPGGVGKSSLAREALRTCAPLFPGGVHWLDLQDLGDAAALVPRWGQQLGLGLPPRDDPLPSLLGQLPTARTLLVLDNAEHLAALPALLRRMLDGAPQLVLLATSRARLQLADEWLLPLPGLAVPDEDSRDLEAASSFDAVRLFERCARAARHDFELARHLDAVIRITELVAGLPLAIELAAGWVRLMPPAQIEADLRQSLELLQQHPAGAEAGARPEHRSLRLVLDRSVAMLAPAEREALAVLSVFQGGFSADDARALGLPGTLPLLSALADKSLLALDTQARPPRFRLHPLVQAYAAGQLAASPVLAARTRAAHAAHFAGLMAQLAPLTRTDALQLVERIEAAYGNVVAAWDEALSLRDAGLLGRMVRAWWVFFELGCRLDEGVRRLWPALELLAEQTDRGLPEAAWAQARLRHGLSMLLHRLGRHEDGLAVAEGGIAAGPAGVELEAHCGCLLNAGSCLWAQGHAHAAHARFEQALALAQAALDRHCIAWALGNLVVSHLELRQRSEALACGEAALAIDRELGNQYQVAVHLINLATCHFDMGQHERAIERSYQAIEHGRRCRLLIFARHAQGNLCTSLLLAGRHEEAAPHVRAVLAHARATGQHGTHMRMLAAQARIEMAAGREPAAWAALREALRVGSSHHLQVELLHTLRGFARLLAARGDRLNAARVLDAAIGHPQCTPGNATAFAQTRQELSIDAALQAAAQRRPLTPAQALSWLECGTEPG